MWRQLTSLCSLLFLVACGQAPEPEPRDETRIRASSLLSEESSPVAENPFTPVTPETVLRFPEDHAPHPSFRQEWWYWTLALWRARDGQIPADIPAEFGAQLVYFRRALAPEPDPEGWRATQVYMTHFAMTHVDADAHRSTEVLSREIPGIANIRGEPFELRLPGSRVRSTGEGFTPLAMLAEAQGYSLNLELRGTEPAILQGLNGYSAKSEEAASHYYSIPRLAVRGAIEWDASTVPVVGWAWMDREWSSQELPRGLVGWDWMALMLQDGSELMVYQLVREDGSRDSFNYGVYRDASGSIWKFESDEFSMLALRSVEFEGDAYPVAWKLTIDSLGELFVEAAIDDQYLQTSVRYWEGLVRVTDSDGEYLGDGYLEMTR